MDFNKNISTSFKLHSVPVIVCFFLLIIVLAGCSESKETRMQRFLLQGNQSVKEQDYPQAERYFKEALKLDSCFADALNNLGTLYQQRQNENDAVVFYTKTIRCNPKFIQAYFNRANVYLTLNKTELAWQDLQVVEKVQPDSVQLHYLKGLILWKGHQYEEAKESFLKVLGKNPKDKNILVNIGSLQTFLKKPDSAEYYLNQALQIDSKDADAMNAMALLQIEKKNLEGATQWIDNALKRRPADPFYLNNKAYILLLKGENASALPLLDESIGSDPYNGWAYRNKGLYYFNIGQIDDAVRLLEQAVAIDPRIERAQELLGKALIKKGDKDKACASLRMAEKQKDITEQELKAFCN